MVRVTAAFSRARTVEAAAAELAGSVESSLQGPNEVAGGLLLATAATGRDAHAIGRVLGRRWPEAELLGTSFEGVLSRGRVWRDEPAVGLFAWREAAGETPIPVCLPPESTGGDRLADLTAAVGSGPQPDRSEADPARGDDGDPRGLLLLFPDCLEPPSQLEGVLTGLARTVIVAGAAASGIDGRAAAAWLGEESLPAATIGVFVPRSCDREAPGRVRLAGASRFASPWLEVDACHGHWVDRLEGEPPLVWVRRQLGLESDSPVESLLDRLLVRVRDPVWVLRDRDRLDEDDESWIEHFVVGVDPERGSLSLPRPLRRGDQLALALPDAERARDALRASIDALAETDLLLQFACRARDVSLHADPDLEAALAASRVEAWAQPGQCLGTVAPFQLVGDGHRRGRLLVHSTVLAAL